MMSHPQRAPQSPHPALGFAEILVRRAALVDELVPALQRGDAGRVRQLADALGEASGQIGAWSRRFEESPRGPERPEMESLLAKLVARVEVADQRLREALSSRGCETLGDWIAAFGAPPEEVARELLAEPWDRARDLLVLVGGADPAVPRALVQEGQRRVLWLNDRGEATDGVLARADLEGLDAACWHLGWPYPQHFRVRSLGACRIGVAAVTERLSETLSIIQSFARSVETMGPELLSRCTENAPLLARYPSAAQLQGALPNIPAIIVSAGPSLDKNIALLSELKGRALIIGINQTVKALRRAGVQPDMVLACDHQNLGYQFEGVREGDIPFLGLGASIAPELFETLAGQRFTFASSPIVESWLFELVGESASLRAGGTISIAALQLALGMGCSPIAVVGQDFALAGAKYYADGAADGGAPLELLADGALSMRNQRSKLRLAQPGREEHYLKAMAESRLELVEVPGYFGAPVLTTPSMRAQIVALRSQLRDARGKAEFVNATEGGAFLEGMDHRPLQWLADRFKDQPHDIHGRLAAALATPDFQLRARRMRQGLTRIHGALSRASKLARALELRGSSRGEERRLGRLKKAAGVVPFLPIVALSAIEGAELTARSATAQGELDAAERELFASIRLAGEAMLAPLERALSRLT